MAEKRSKKELLRAFKAEREVGGVYAIKNRETGRALIQTTTTISKAKGILSFAKLTGSCVHPAPRRRLEGLRPRRLRARDPRNPRPKGRGDRRRVRGRGSRRSASFGPNGFRKKRATRRRGNAYLLRALARKRTLRARSRSRPSAITSYAFYPTRRARPCQETPSRCMRTFTK